jgi:unsaturated chondroitin disaccharide hydrolase
MKKTIFIVFSILIFFIAAFVISVNRSTVKDNLSFAEKQEALMLEKIDNSALNPRSMNKDGSLKLVQSSDWTSGFFPGCLWYLYDYTKDDKWKKSAELFTNNVEKEQYNGGTHDMGFKMYCSYGNGFRLTGNKKYKKILLQSAKTLITRFNSKVGCIRSWDHSKDSWEYPVIIDNMMNLELLFWATQISGDSTFYKIAVAHANTTMKNHFRNDYSSWHVVNYDTLTGKVLSKETHQGYADSSCWSRGEAWALYGFTMCYRETKDSRYLEQAEHIANYILTNKNLPKDMVPYWDYNAPNIPNEDRDASAGAIMCSAFYELSSYDDNDREKYLSAADKILNSLSSENYLARIGKNEDFILMHSVGSKPGNSEVDVPLIYADYYFLEANLRKLKYENENN